MADNLPNFLIVGAAKSGTTSLHHYLKQHPQIFMSDKDENGISFKEPMFLVKENVQHRIYKGKWTLEEYKRLFSKVQGEKAIGEASVFYLNFFEESIPNIKKYLGNDVKIIIILRNPVDRAYSAYQHTARNNKKERLTFEESLEVEERRYNRDTSITPMTLYKQMGMYYKMVKAFKDNFDTKVIIYEDFNENNKGILKEVFRFLEVADDFEINTEERKNVGGWQWDSEIVKNMYYGNSIGKRIFKKILGLFPGIKKIMIEKIVRKNKIDNPPMNAATRSYLVNYYNEDVELLEELLNFDLSRWKK